MQNFDDLPVQDTEKTESLIQALGEDRYLDLISLVPPEVEKILERYRVPEGNDSSTLDFVGPDRRRDAQRGAAAERERLHARHVAARLRVRVHGHAHARPARDLAEGEQHASGSGEGEGEGKGKGQLTRTRALTR